MNVWCPGCRWEPTNESRWMCAPQGCYHSWNTFDTGGVCPACSKIWKMTQCLSCHNHYPHQDWYHGTGDASVAAEIDLTIEEVAPAPAELI